MKKNVLLILCIIATTAFSQTKVIAPKTYKYHSFVGDDYNMLLYEGKSVNLLIPDKLLQDDKTLTKMVAVLDSVWNFYYKMTTVLPNPNGLFGAKGYVAFVENSCGAGCAFIGTSGVEVGSAGWKNIYDNVKYFENYSVLKIAFYEFGRNFFNSQISDKISVDPFHIPEPFATMGYLNAIDLLKLYLPNQYENEMGYKSDLLNRANEYILDSEATTIGKVYEQSLYPFEHGNVNFKPFFNSGLLMKLCHDYDNNFIFNFLPELYKLPSTNGNINEAYTNFCIASSKALNKNMKPFFKEGYKMPLNEARVDEALASLGKFGINFISQDNRILGFFSNDSVLVRVKAVSGQNATVTYDVYRGEVGDNSAKILTTTKSTFYLKTQKNNCMYWVKASDGESTAISQPIQYLYRGNLIKDNSFDQAPNTFPVLSSSSIEANSREGYLLSAVRTNGTSFSGNYSLMFDHSFVNDCNGLDGSNFPNIDYSQTYIEPFKGKYRVSAYMKVEVPYAQCQNVFANAWIRFGVKHDGFWRFGPTLNSASNQFNYVFLDVDSRENTENEIKNTFYLIMSEGISGKAYVDDISVKAILPPEPVKILSINSNQSKKVVATYNQKDFISMLIDSAQDISEYAVVYSKDSTFNTNYQTIKSSKSKFAFSIKDVGTYYVRTYATNEFGQSEYSPIKEILITNTPPIANAGTNQEVNEGTNIILDGSGSSDPDGNLITYKWKAPVGITLSSISSPNPTFIAPEVKENTTLGFSLIVNDGLIDSPASYVSVIVQNVIKTGIADIASKNLATYPNPTSGILKIEGLREDQENRISVYTVDGILIKTITSNSATEVIDLSSQPYGTYLLNINSESFKIVKK